jgi:hypothetical protein
MPTTSDPLKVFMIQLPLCFARSGRLPLTKPYGFSQMNTMHGEVASSRPNVGLVADYPNGGASERKRNGIRVSVQTFRGSGMTLRKR